MSILWKEKCCDTEKYGRKNLRIELSERGELVIQCSVVRRLTRLKIFTRFLFERKKRGKKPRQRR